MHDAVKREILLVEDDAADAELTLLALRRSNVPSRVTVARDGVEAWERLSNGGRLPTLILLDLKMPRMDGLQVLRQIRSQERTRLTPTVMFTSSDLDRDVEESYRLGCNSYIRKPIDFGELLALVGQITDYWLRHNQCARTADAP